MVGEVSDQADAPTPGRKLFKMSGGGRCRICQIPPPTILLSNQKMIACLIQCVRQHPTYMYILRQLGYTWKCLVALPTGLNFAEYYLSVLKSETHTATTLVEQMGDELLRQLNTEQVSTLTQLKEQNLAETTVDFCVLPVLKLHAPQYFSILSPKYFPIKRLCTATVYINLLTNVNRTKSFKFFQKILD